MPRDRNKEALLLDYYGSLLTEHQQNVLEEYYNEDLSMNEIADNLQISKSAVGDLIKRCQAQLEEYEDKLGLISRNIQIKALLKEIKQEANGNIEDIISEIEKLI